MLNKIFQNYISFGKKLLKGKERAHVFMTLFWAIVLLGFTPYDLRTLVLMVLGETQVPAGAAALSISLLQLAGLAIASTLLLALLSGLLWKLEQRFPAKKPRKRTARKLAFFSWVWLLRLLSQLPPAALVYLVLTNSNARVFELFAASLSPSLTNLPMWAVGFAIIIDSYVTFQFLWRAFDQRYLLVKKPKRKAYIRHQWSYLGYAKNHFRQLMERSK